MKTEQSAGAAGSRLQRLVAWARAWFGECSTTHAIAMGALAMSAAAITLPAAAQPLERIKVRLDWAPWGNVAAIHLAQQKGWYRKAGLEVETEDGNGSVTTIQIVGSSNAFDVGHAALAPMMIARDKGLPVKALAVFARRSDVGLLVPTDSNITGPAQLRGRRVAYTAGSLEAPFIDAFLAKGGLKREDVQLVSIDAAGKAASYAVGRTDAIFSTIPFVLPTTTKSRPSKPIPFAEFGLNSPSFGLVVSEAKMAERGAALSKFAAVVAYAWEYIYAGHEDEAVDAVLAQRPQARLDRAIVREQIDGLKYFFDLRPGTRIGNPVPADWETAVKTLSSVGLIGTSRPATDYYLPSRADPAAVEKLLATP